MATKGFIAAKQTGIMSILLGIERKTEKLFQKTNEVDRVVNPFSLSRKPICTDRLLSKPWRKTKKWRHKNNFFCDKCLKNYFHWKRMSFPNITNSPGKEILNFSLTLKFNCLFPDHGNLSLCFRFIPVDCVLAREKTTWNKPAFARLCISGHISQAMASLKQERLSFWGSPTNSKS